MLQDQIKNLKKELADLVTENVALIEDLKKWLLREGKNRKLPTKH